MISVNLCKEEMFASVEPIHSEWRCRRSSIESLEVMRRRVASLAITESCRSTLAKRGPSDGPEAPSIPDD